MSTDIFFFLVDHSGSSFLIVGLKKKNIANNEIIGRHHNSSSFLGKRCGRDVVAGLDLRFF